MAKHLNGKKKQRTDYGDTAKMNGGQMGEKQVKMRVCGSGGPTGRTERETVNEKLNGKRSTHRSEYNAQRKTH